jgi:hypothetical protein
MQKSFVPRNSNLYFRGYGDRHLPIWKVFPTNGLRLHTRPSKAPKLPPLFAENNITGCAEGHAGGKISEAAQSRRKVSALDASACNI